MKHLACNQSAKQNGVVKDNKNNQATS